MAHLGAGFQLIILHLQVLLSLLVQSWHVWGVSKDRGTSKRMVYNGKPYFLMDDLGGKPIIFGNIPFRCANSNHNEATVALQILRIPNGA